MRRAVLGALVLLVWCLPVPTRASGHGGLIVYTVTHDKTTYLRVMEGHRRLRDLPADFAADPEISRDHRFIAFTDWASANDRVRVLVIASIDGRVRRVLRVGSGGVFHPSWSPDGKQIAVAVVTHRYAAGAEVDGCEVRIVDVASALSHSVLDLGSGLSSYPSLEVLPSCAQEVTWSPEGDLLAVTAMTFAVAAARFDLLTVRPDGSDLKVVAKGYDGMDPAFSPDGSWIVYGWAQRTPLDAAGEVRMVRVDGSDDRRVAMVPGRILTCPTFAPDGRSVLLLNASADESQTQLQRFSLTGRLLERLTPADESVWDPNWRP